VNETFVPHFCHTVPFQHSFKHFTVFIPELVHQQSFGLTITSISDDVHKILQQLMTNIKTSICSLLWNRPQILIVRKVGAVQLKTPTLSQHHLFVFRHIFLLHEKYFTLIFTNSKIANSQNIANTCAQSHSVNRKCVFEKLAN
jgi:hypothetical protein